jgi:TM2 domain-containing membrane protein YozV
MTEKKTDEKFCHSCGEVINKEAEICPKCGVRQQPAQNSSTEIQSDIALGQKNKIVAALLAFFLGGFGLHKFYLGKVGAGILYLLFSWTFIPSIIAFFEAVSFLLVSDQAFKSKYG